MNRCSQCRFFHANPPAESPGAVTICGDEVRGGGECRRRIPVPTKRDARSVAVFPIVFCGQWCGEFQPKKDLSKPALDAETYFADELMRMRRTPQFRHGNVEFVPGNNTIRLYVYPGGNFYEVDLDKCTDARSALDWILLLNEKTWCDGRTLKDFLACLNDACRFTKGEDAIGFLVHGKTGGDLTMPKRATLAAKAGKQ